MTPVPVPFNVPRGLAVIAAKPPALFLPEPKDAGRFFDFFTANIRLLPDATSNLERLRVRQLIGLRSQIRRQDCRQTLTLIAEVVSGDGPENAQIGCRILPGLVD